MSYDSRLSSALVRIVPVWLQATRAFRLLSAIGSVLDLLLRRLVEGVKLRFPGLVSFGAAWDDPDIHWDDPGLVWSADTDGPDLAYHSRDRRIRRGRSEPAAIFATRLQNWLDNNKQRGNVPAMLRQIRSYYYPQTFVIQCVSRSGLRHRMVADGTITRDEVGFNPDAFPDDWARLWLYYYDPEGFTPDGTWDDPGTWDDGGVWDFEMTVADADRARTVPREWLAEHIGEARIVVVSGGVPQGEIYIRSQ